MSTYKHIFITQYYSDNFEYYRKRATSHKQASEATFRMAEKAWLLKQENK